MKEESYVVPPALQSGMAALKYMDGVDILKEPTWDHRERRWVLHCRFTVPPGSVWPLPVRTAWYILIEPVYPAGSIKIYPAKSGGIVDTFPHQSLNLPGASDSPWRTGAICVHEGSRALGRLGGTREPSGADERLAWYIHKALEWIKAASWGDLNGTDDLFEVPDFDVSRSSIIGFSEDHQSFALWENLSNRSGIATLYTPRPAAQPVITVVRSYQTSEGHNLYVPQWGKAFEPSSARALETCLWVRFPQVPCFSPWRAPTTWGELVQLSKDMIGIDLDQLVQAHSRQLRKQSRPILLCGFPIPMKIGQAVIEYYWQAVQLPKLVSADKPLRGFRNTERNRKTLDRLSYRRRSSLLWLKSENWHSSTRSVRGQFSAELTNCRVLMIGGGALGSVIAELLVRGGVNHLTISDNDIMMAGNLSRHTLTLQDMGELKAQSLAKRLNWGSPHSHIQAMGPFPPRSSKDHELVSQADLIIDCTGGDDVLYSLMEFDWARPRIFYSCSLDWQARRSFCYYTKGMSFPAQACISDITPHLEEDSDSEDRFKFAREGIGCWHPVMPARIDDVWMLAAAAVRYLDESIQGKNPSSPLAVFVRDEKNGFSGICRI